MSDEREKWVHLMREYPGDFSFRGELLPIIAQAIKEFNAVTGAGSSLIEYEIGVGVGGDRSYAAISFLPDPAYIADRGASEVGEHRGNIGAMGLIYVYDVKDKKLVSQSYVE